LYELAYEAAKAGSTAALEMLVALPDMLSLCRRGWLFEFGFADSSGSRPILSEQWVFRAAHDTRFPPISKDEKLRELITFLEIDASEVKSEQDLKVLA
jgi:hypothetical protein